MKIVTNIIRFIVGILFIISGFVKLVDPIGFSYKLEEYFGPEVFNLPILQKIALPIASIFVISELILGIFLLLGFKKKLTLTLLFLLVIFFSFLTFYSAYFNKVTDCGCFGDALKLTPWTSFIKDIVFLILISFLIIQKKYIHPLFGSIINNCIIGVALLICLWIAYIGIYFLPLIDFRPYAIGKDLKAGIKDGIPQKEEIFYDMENIKTKDHKNISSNEYIESNIWQDSLWSIKNTTTKIIKKGVISSVHDFDIECGKNNITEEVLNAHKIFLFTIPFIKKLSTKDKNILRKITTELSNKKIKFVIATNDPKQLIPINSCLMDQTTLKTINRSKIGLLLLKNGIVTAKFSFNRLPTNIELENL